MKTLRPNSRSWLRSALEDTILARKLKRLVAAAAIRRWRKNGSTGPPPHAYKRALVRRLARCLGYRVFVETGTFYGDMLADVSDTFRQIVSIELDPHLCRLARRRLRTQEHIEVLGGDSGVVLTDVLTRITEPCIFWLDAHFSGARTAIASTETPIVAEIEAILKHRIQKHVILIDDARCFNGTHDYPRVTDLRNRVAQHSDQYTFVVSDDVIRIGPRIFTGAS